MDSDSAVATKDSYAEIKDDAQLVGLWLDAIGIASDEEEDWRKQAGNSVALYRQKTVAANKNEPGKKFNIHHSNIETMLPALYNSMPVPDVRRRYNDPDPTAKAVSDILERAISYSIDSYDFDHVMKHATADSELTGRAVTRIRYMPYVGKDDTLDYQETQCEHVEWKHFRRGPGNIWTDG